MYICMYLPTGCILLLRWLCYFKNRSVIRYKDDLYVKKCWKVFAASQIHPIVSSTTESMCYSNHTELGALGLIPRLSLFSVILMYWHRILLLLILTIIAIIINSFKCYISFYSLTFSFSKNSLKKANKEKTG